MSVQMPATQNAASPSPNPSLSQGIGKTQPSADEVRNTFLEMVDKTPAELIRAMILAEEGLTEEEFAALPPEEQEKIEKKIIARLEEKMELGMEENLKINQNVQLLASASQPQNGQMLLNTDQTLDALIKAQEQDRGES
ncbi:MAG: hypothetical protein CL565_06815 [Alphaproteobacteria bacterium]|nr:hypothetical protein [Alphaproteobacteria bacterium]